MKLPDLLNQVPIKPVSKRQATQALFDLIEKNTFDPMARRELAKLMRYFLPDKPGIPANEFVWLWSLRADKQDKRTHLRYLYCDGTVITGGNGQVWGLVRNTHNLPRGFYVLDPKRMRKDLVKLHYRNVGLYAVNVDAVYPDMEAVYRQQQRVLPDSSVTGWVYSQHSCVDAIYREVTIDQRSYVFNAVDLQRADHYTLSPKVLRFNPDTGTILIKTLYGLAIIHEVRI